MFYTMVSVETFEFAWKKWATSTEFGVFVNLNKKFNVSI